MNELLKWLLAGDVAIQYQVHRDLLDADNAGLQARIACEGWGARFLKNQNSDGHWGRGFYQPKWTSTHYTVLDLKNLCISPDTAAIRQTVRWIAGSIKSKDGGIFPIGAKQKSDVCVNGMYLNYAAYFGIDESDLRSVVDFLLNEQMPGGGFNCRSNGPGAVHSSLHTTISVMEGILEYRLNGYKYRLPELRQAEADSLEFVLQHRLFRSDHTRNVIDKRMLLLSWPSRWRYDILRALDHFRRAGISYDSRMDDALEVLLKKRRVDRKWTVQARHPGQTHFEMEKPGKPSRWNTLRAMRVLRYFQIEDAG